MFMLKPQEIPFDAPESCCRFEPRRDKPFVATREAMAAYGQFGIVGCLRELQRRAKMCGGLDYLQVFECPGKPEPLWFIDDGASITALLPSEY